MPTNSYPEEEPVVAQEPQYPSQPPSPSSEVYQEPEPEQQQHQHQHEEEFSGNNVESHVHPESIPSILFYGDVKSVPTGPSAFDEKK